MAGPGYVPGQPPGPGPYPGGAQQNAWAPPAAPKSRRTLLWVVIGAVVLVALVVAGFFLFSKISKDNAAKAEASREAAIQDSVQQYLQALADGHASKALDQLDTKPASTQLLTDKVLAASKTAAPITDISVSLVSPTGNTGDSVQVKASYRLGKDVVEQTFTVRDHGGTWKIVVGTATVDLTKAGTGNLPLAVNGQAVGNPKVAVLFPGSYTLTTTASYIAFTSTSSTFTVTDPDKVDVGTVTAVLTDAGQAAFRQAVSDAVNACIASTSLTPGCGLNMKSSISDPGQVDDGATLGDGTITRTATAGVQAWLDSLSPKLYGSDPATAYADPPSGEGVTVTATVTLTNGRSFPGIGITPSDSPNQPWSFGSPHVDMSDPDNLVVTWS